MTKTIAKHLAFALLLTSSSAFAAGSKGSGRPDVYTTSLVKTKAGVSYDDAKKAFEGLNVVLHKTKGFEKKGETRSKTSGSIRSSGSTWTWPSRV